MKMWVVDPIHSFCREIAPESDVHSVDETNPFFIFSGTIMHSFSFRLGMLSVLFYNARTSNSL